MAAHSSSDAKAGGTRRGHPAQPGPVAPHFPGRKGAFPPARPVRYVQSVMEQRVAGGGSSPSSRSGRAHGEEPPLLFSPPEHRRPGLTRRVLPRHPYTPWVPPTAWDRYSWSGGACPIMPSCHGALQAPPLPAAAAVPEHSSGEGWLLPATPCTPGAALFPAVAPLSGPRWPGSPPSCWLARGAAPDSDARAVEQPGMVAPLLSCACG